jgi:uncharacterized protein YwgA
MRKLIELARLIKTLENAGIYEFKIDTFEDRLRLQKIIYIAKHFGIDLGYSFNEYLRGPYSPELADDYYELEKLWNTDTIKSLETLDGENVRELIEFVKDKSINELEGIATGLMFVRILKMRGIKDGKELKKKLSTIIESRKPFLSDIVDEIADIVVSRFSQVT